MVTQPSLDWSQLQEPAIGFLIQWHCNFKWLLNKWLLTKDYLYNNYLNYYILVIALVIIIYNFTYIKGRIICSTVFRNHVNKLLGTTLKAHKHLAKDYTILGALSL